MAIDLGYFREHASQLLLEESIQPGVGLRRGQIGALYALGAHFAARTDPAVVSLPTGYGKTAVLLGACFLLRATRALIIEPTRALRTQTFGQMEQLHPLKRLGALPLSVPLPAVLKVESRISNVSGWEALNEAHLVVATPHCVSPFISGTPAPPPALFDLILVDEGHHAAAPTWEALIKAFPAAKHVLVSATPFRLDRRELPGKTVFHYPLKRAVAEKAFSKVVFRNVISPNPADAVATDTALAKAADEVFDEDRRRGFEHRMLIRAGSKAAADELASLYSRTTKLRVQAVHSGMSRRRNDALEKSLKSGDLDGVICVDMFGEGYDLPLLKIGVLHAPHQSLVPSLQFIGRFARTSSLKTGDATFLAVRDEVAVEGRRLYDEGVDWDEMLAGIADGAQLLELTRQETLQSYDDVIGASADYDAVNPGNVAIFKHVVVYRCGQPPALERPCVAIRSLQVVRQWFSKKHHSCLLLGADIRPPAWLNQQAVIDARHDLLLLIYRPLSGRLYIGATKRSPGFYDALVAFFVGGHAWKLSYGEMKKVLSGLKDLVHHSVGVKNISPGSPESYRIMSGSAADRGIGPGDARTFRQGHFMGRGRVNGNFESIGASSTSRTWGSGFLRLPEFLKYVQEMDARLGSSAPIAKSGLDLLPLGRPLTDIPDNTVAASWPKEARRQLPRARRRGGRGKLEYLDLVDLEFRDFLVAADQKSMRFSVGDDDFRHVYAFRVDATPAIIPYGVTSDPIEVDIGSEWNSLGGWLSEYPPIFYSSNLEAFEGRDWLGAATPSGARLTEDDLMVWDWTGCETTCEFDLKDVRRMTVHQFLRTRLLADADYRVIWYDHRSGELADYVGVTVSPEHHATLHLFHCKGAGGALSGARTADASELVPQAIKCLTLLQKDGVLEHVKRRSSSIGHHSTFARGHLALFERLVVATEPIDLRFEIYAVQPGIARSELKSTLIEPMAAAVSYVNSVSKCRLRWLIADDPTTQGP